MTESKDHSVAAAAYAGDTTALLAASAAGSSVFVFRIEADAEPNTFARVAGVFNIANTAPQRVSLRRGSPGQVNISIEIELAQALTADMIRRKLEQLTCTILAEWVAGESSVAVPR
jgi:hypothetical protein